MLLKYKIIYELLTAEAFCLIKFNNNEYRKMYELVHKILTMLI